MKKTLLIFAAALTLGAVSCQKEGKGTGGLEFDITSDVMITDEVKSKVSDFTALPAAKDFTLTIRNADEEVAWTGLLSEWTTTTTLPVGIYSVTANYGSVTAEGADKPCFAGTVSFSVSGTETVKVSIPVKLENCILKTVCTENFKKYFTACDFKITSGNNNEFHFDSASSNAIFIEAYKFSLGGTLTNQGGYSTTIETKEFTDLEAATCYTLKFDASNVGGLKVTISFNDTVQTMDMGDIELNN